MKQFLINLLIGLIISFSGCYQDQDSLSDVEVGKMDDYYFEKNIEVETIEDATRWSRLNITYKLDNNDYWQLPEETYKLKTGDCEDFAIMLMYLFKTKLNLESYLYFVKIENRYHSLCYCNGIYYEHENNYTEITFPDNYNTQWACTYEEAIWMTYYYHRNVGKYY